MTIPFYSINASVVEHERVNGEVIVISFKSGKYFSLSGNTADIWTLLINGSSLDSLQENLKKYWKFNKDIKQDLLEFLEEAISEEIVLEAETINLIANELPLDQERNEWHKPKLMIFGNLQDLIMVDPVHDASLINWPVQKDFEFEN